MQHKQASYKYELRDPHIKPPRLVFDTLLYVVVAAYFILLAIIIISTLLPLPDKTPVLYGLLMVKSPWFDTLEAFSYLLIATAAIAFIASELEVTARRFIWRRHYYQATRKYPPDI